jgi:hypothetical protein
MTGLPLFFSKLQKMQKPLSLINKKKYIFIDVMNQAKVSKTDNTKNTTINAYFSN